MKKVLFIDRDGTMIIEPSVTCQVDAWEKLEFYPGCLNWLSKIAGETNYELVMVTNQDGLGTPGYPLEIFEPIQKHILNTFMSVGVRFAAVHIDRSFPKDNLPTRKPGIAMLTGYMDGQYDLKNSFVIGDRLTDVKLAANLGCKCIWLNKSGKLSEKDETDFMEERIKNAVAVQTEDWEEIYTFLKLPQRRAKIERNTNETQVMVEVNLDGEGKCAIQTGLGFFDHMLEQLGKHSLTDLVIQVKGDLHIDEHHTIEDTALALGSALKEAIGNKKGIERYGFCLPMDDCEAHVSLDFAGRPWLVWDAEFKREKIGEMPTEMFMHFFKSLSDNALMNVNIRAMGTNEHHKIEAIFKAFAKALKMAKKRDDANNSLPSTKGVL
ncbi:MAG TPA: bifunctional histidinol-phosphatase/imidazoleglycerol-phosphate dehydratase HisB [Flavobacteriales bacterium]|nr:bifunctional histidinol-phosphatase/imidazoleglycerol-phosphate dehydratase HisB [Flavobacteriales bacterium]